MPRNSSIPSDHGTHLRGRNHRRLRADLRASCGDGAAFGGMVGIGETYLPAFALAVGLGELTAGLVGSVPLVAGGVLQLVSPAAIRLLRSHKRWVVCCATIQALTFLPLIAAAWRGWISGPALLAIASLYWACGLAAGPAWNTWIGTIVPPAVRPSFFAVRSRASQATVFLGFLVGGIGLQWAVAEELVLPVYSVLFAAAAACRLVSAGLLAVHSEPNPLPANMRRIAWSEVWGLLSRRQGGRLLIYLALVQASVQLAGPYFTPFMFEKLRLSYGEFVALIAVAFLAKVLALPAWGRLARRMGAWPLLWIGGIGIAPLAAGWLVSRHLYWLVALQVFGGVTWAAYELAFFLLFFESITEDERTGMLTVYNLINTMAWVAGSLAGGAMLYAGGASYDVYLLIFALSSLGRCLALVLLFRLRSFDVKADGMAVRTIAVRPHSASLDAPVLPSLPDQLPDATHPSAT